MPTKMVDSRRSPRFGGVATFCRYPELAGMEAGEAGGVEWIVYGVPHDGGVTYRPGARFGPRAVRGESQYVKRYHTVHGVDVCAALSIADGGDAPVLPYELEGCLAGVAAWAGEQKPEAAGLIAVGGDHSIALANMRATRARLERRGMWPGGGGASGGGLAVVHFDAHLDTVDEVWGEKWGHASPFRRAMEEGLIDGGAMLSVGVRGPLNAAGDLEYARERGITLVSAETVLEDEGEARARVAEFVQRVEGRPVYVTVDVDVLEPAFAPGTGTPCPGGLTPSQVFGLMRRLAGVNVVGGDVVEVLPDRDVGGITALFAGHIVFEMLALAAVAKRGGGCGK